MSNIHCISYASNNFLERSSSFQKEALNFKEFNAIKIYNKNDLDTNFINLYDEILSASRGGGYWIWKSQIIQQHLNYLQENDILFYTDVGCSFINTPQSKKTFNYYLEIINENNFLRFATDYLELEYSNSCSINFFCEKYNQKYNKLSNSKHLMATIMAFKKTKKVLNFLNEFSNCLKENCWIITDKYNLNNKNKNFKDHRHDQSLFSLLYKSLGYNIAIKDNTWHTDFSKITDVPIISTRLKK